MKRKIATLEVYLDDSPGAVSHTDTFGYDIFKPVSWEIVVAPNEQTKEGLKGDSMTLLCHELGHFAAQVLGTPRAKAQIGFINALQAFPARLLAKIGLTPDKYKQTLLEAEKEAWEVSRKVGRIQEDYAKAALETYENGSVEDALFTSLKRP